MQSVALLMVLAMAACVSGGASQPSVTVVEQCMAESGFTARAAAAPASGGQAVVSATPKELAAINACEKAKATAAPSAGGRRVVVETESNGTMTVETYTRATPPVAAKAAASTARTGRRACRNTMVGGDGYACVPI